MQSEASTCIVRPLFILVNSSAQSATVERALTLLPAHSRLKAALSSAASTYLMTKSHNHVQQNRVRVSCVRQHAACHVSSQYIASLLLNSQDNECIKCLYVVHKSVETDLTLSCLCQRHRTSWTASLCRHCVAADSAAPQESAAVASAKTT